MSLTFQFSQDVDTVFNMMTDPDFLVERSLELGELSAECEAEDIGSKTIIKMKREVEQDLPSFLAKVFSAKQTMEFEEEWQSQGDNKTGKYIVTIVGQPVTMSAKFSLNATAAGCEYTIEHKAKVKIPLIGGKVEKYIAGQIGREVGKEIEYTRNKLGK